MLRKFTRCRKRSERTGMKMKRKLCGLSLLLAVCLLFAGWAEGASAAFAQAAEDVTNTGLDFTGGFPQVETVYRAGEGTITYTPAAEGSVHRLTLDNASVTAPEAEGKPAIHLPDGSDDGYCLDIELVGNSSLSSLGEGDSNNMKGRGIYGSCGSGQAVKICGTGTLDISAYKVGIQLESGDLKVEHTDLRIKTKGNFANGIRLKNGDCSISGGHMSIEPLEPAGNYGIYLDKGSLAVTNAQIEFATKNEALWMGGSSGIRIESSTLKADVTGEDVMGAFSAQSGDLVISGGSDVTLSCLQCRFGLYSNCKVIIQDSKVVVEDTYEGYRQQTPYPLYSYDQPEILGNSRVILIHHPDTTPTNWNTQERQPKVEETAVLLTRDSENRTADYTKVDGAIAKAEALNPASYKDFSGVEAAVSAVERNKDVLQQEEVDEMARAIEAAIQALKPIESAGSGGGSGGGSAIAYADYTKVDQAIKKANALDKTLYKDCSVVEAAVKAVVWGKLSIWQKEVDSMAEAIENAIGALEYRDADYTKVDEAIAKASSLDPACYSNFSQVKAAIGSVDRRKNITQQEEVDQMAAAIEAALLKLEQKPVDLRPDAVSVKIADKAYTGKAIKPTAKVKYGNQTLKKGTDYTVSYENNTKIGKAAAVIKGKGSYQGTIRTSFLIVPAKQRISGLKAGKNKFTIRYKKQEARGGKTGYRIVYSPKKGQAKGVNTTSTQKTIRGLKSQKRYKVKVCVYKTIGGKKYMGAYSQVKRVKTK